MEVIRSYRFAQGVNGRYNLSIGKHLVQGLVPLVGGNLLDQLTPECDAPLGTM